MDLRQSLLIISFAFLATLSLFSCASQRYTKKAAKFEAAGLHEDAADYYYEAVKKKPGNIDAKLGLRKTGQQTLDKKLKAVKDAYQQSDFEDVVYYYIAAKKYDDKIDRAGVDLTFPEIYRAYYDEAKQDFLTTLYNEGLNKLNREEFKDAQQVFQEIIDIEPNYKDAAEKYTIAKTEPVYREANTYYENEMYRSAYYAYDKIIRETGNYKQALPLKNDAREKGTISLLVSEFDFAHQSYLQTAKIITSGIKSRLNEIDNPFIKIIDEAAVHDRIYKNGKIDRQAAKLMGINSILSGKVIYIQKTSGRLQKETKKGYLENYRTTVNSEGKTVKTPDFKKTEYTQYKQANSAQLQMDFSLVSTENSEVIISDLFKLNKTDEVNYARFEGNKDKLVPGYWKSKSYQSKADVIKDNYSDKKALKKLLSADRTPKTVSAIIGELTDESVRKTVNKIDNFNPEK